jgi:hypothetical protein
MRNDCAALLGMSLMAIALAACGEREHAPVAAKRHAPPLSADTTATAQADAGTADERLGRPVAVAGQANIFGAGHSEPPQPGGGGRGKLPPGWRLPHADHGVLTVRHVVGRVNPRVGDVNSHGAAGDGLGPTDVTSYGGISGIIHRNNGMFLVGVFLSDAAPSDPAPPRLDFTWRDRPRILAPRVGQTFMVGDGKGRTYRVPPEATRLFLGFADAYLYEGAPGWYGNNGGQVSVTVRLSDHTSE